MQTVQLSSLHTLTVTLVGQDLTQRSMCVGYVCRDRKRWILSVPVKGELWLDSGAVAAVKQHSKSLFAAGILNIQGAFAAQDAVVLCDDSGYEFARGLCNYTCQELLKVQVSKPVLTCVDATACLHPAARDEHTRLKDIAHVRKLGVR